MTIHLAHVFSSAAESHRAARQEPRPDEAQAPSDGLTASLQDLLQLHGESSTAVILLIMASACVMPVGGIGTMLSLAMVVLAWRWARRLETQALPERLGRVRLNETWTHRTLHGFAWVYRTAARWLRPRWAHLAHDHTRPWWAMWIGLMAFLIFLPIPFGNVLPALSLVMLSLGWMFRDGAALILSKLVGLGALGFALTFGHLMWEGVEKVNAWALTL